MAQLASVRLPHAPWVEPLRPLETAAEPAAPPARPEGFQRHQKASWCQSECHRKYANSSLPTSIRVRMTVDA